ncbi:hypothetical protein AB0B66_30050 [Catellatospora sp. NPDC049111]|uniref:hypothetical protein n=1 Tax=Catellatospora sp. NPDC049111 TaxID=3155271 RepID=UPI0033F2A84E
MHKEPRFARWLRKASLPPFMIGSVGLVFIPGAGRPWFIGLIAAGMAGNLIAIVVMMKHAGSSAGKSPQART